MAALQLLGEHRCFGGVQRFYRHDSREIGLPMQFSVYLPPQALELELTESTLLEAGTQTSETLAALKQLGVGLAIDDFGTGYSSLCYLKRIPITALKIDQSFVRDLVTDADDRTLAATIIALGHGLGEIAGTGAQFQHPFVAADAA